MKRKRTVGFDLIKAFAIISIIIFHIDSKILPAGFLGVDLFFVLSGYLAITSIKRDEDFSLVKYLKNKLINLFPPLFFVIFIVMIFATLFNKSAVKSTGFDGIFGITFLENWRFLIKKISYFDSFSISLFKHIWYIAVQFQFFIIFSLLYRFTYKKRKNGINLFWIFVPILMVLSFVLQVVLYDPQNVNRVYYGTDTRLYEFLIGVITGGIYPLNKIKSLSDKKTNNIFSLVSGICLIVFIYLELNLSEYSKFLYLGGFFLIALISALFIVTFVKYGSKTKIIFNFSFIRYIGKISYDIYLWHFPILILSQTQNEINHPNIYLTLIRIILFLCLSIFSYAFSKKIIKNFKNIRMNFIAKVIILIFSILFIFGSFGYAMPFLSTLFVKENDFKLDNKLKINSKVSNSNENSMTIEKEKSEEKEVISSNYSSMSNSNVKKFEAKIPYNTIILIGDSLGVNVGAGLADVFPNTIVDAQVSRQLINSIDIAWNYHAYDSKDTAVVFMLGTNGPFEEEDLDELVKPFEKSDIYFVNIRVDRAYEKDVNKYLDNFTSKNKRIHLINWHDASIDHPEYFAPDKVHLMNNGIDVILDLIFDEMNKVK
ncbi:MAG: acyltransferase family protein [Peptoniphilaceae bacterium]|nr:acyltransferase [Peptoniphilaceae bacterium]MDD7383677.1 acyltransferase family protein [Peptoniphilaceae bacterium]MDY3738774.1 acyltransferase family protein [Peptoniphilaceae bacterium]